MTPISAEPHVTLLDDLARPVGAMAKLAAHGSPGHRHLAFSVMLTDPDGRILLQRRAATKYHFAGRWANACCSHPRPGQPLLDAARQRLREELGLYDEVVLGVHGAFWYHAVDAASELVEHEYDVVIRGQIQPLVRMELDPREVAEVAWYEPSDARALARDPALGAPWLVRVLEVASKPRVAVADELVSGDTLRGPRPNGTGEPPRKAAS